MTMTSTVTFEGLRDLAQKQLTEYLDEYSMDKSKLALFWDEDLTGPMDTVANYAFLKRRNVDKMHLLSGQNPDNVDLAGVENAVFVIKPAVANMKLVAKIIRSDMGTFLGNVPRLIGPRG